MTSYLRNVDLLSTFFVEKCGPRLLRCKTWMFEEIGNSNVSGTKICVADAYAESNRHSFDSATKHCQMNNNDTRLNMM